MMTEKGLGIKTRPFFCIRANVFLSLRSKRNLKRMNSSLVQEYTVSNNLSGAERLFYNYKLYKRYVHVFTTAYYMEFQVEEKGEKRSFTEDLVTGMMDARTLFSRICFKGYLRVQESLHKAHIQELMADEVKAHYFSWDADIHGEHSWFDPNTESYHFQVGAWHPNHTAYSRQFLTQIGGNELEACFPEKAFESLVWILTNDEAHLHKYNWKTKQVLEEVFSYDAPKDLFLLMAACNSFRYYYDKYAVAK